MAMALQPWAIGLDAETGEDLNLLKILAERRKANKDHLMPGMKEALARAPSGRKGAAVAAMAAVSGGLQGFFDRQDAAKESKRLDQAAITAANFLRKSDPRFAKYPPGVLEKTLRDNPTLIATLTGKAFESPSWSLQKIDSGQKDEYGRDLPGGYVWTNNRGETRPYIPGQPPPDQAASQPQQQPPQQQPPPAPVPEQTPPQPQGQEVPGLPQGYRATGGNTFIGPDGKPVAAQNIPKQPLDSNIPLTPAVNPPQENAPVKLPTKPTQMGAVIPGPDGAGQQPVRTASAGPIDPSLLRPSNAPQTLEDRMNQQVRLASADGGSWAASARSPRFGQGVVPPLPPQAGTTVPPPAPQPRPPAPQPRPAEHTLETAPGYAPQVIPDRPAPGQDPVQWAKDRSALIGLSKTGAPAKEVADMRKSFESGKVYDKYTEASQMFEAAKGSANLKNRAGDIGMIYNIATMLDPGSVVREPDALMIKNVASSMLPQEVKDAISKVNNKQAIDDQTRQYLMDLGHAQLKGYEAPHLRRTDQYREDAAKAFVKDPGRVAPQLEQVQPWTIETAPTMAPLYNPRTGVPVRAGSVVADTKPFGEPAKPGRRDAQGVWIPGDEWEPSHDPRASAQNPPIPPMRPVEDTSAAQPRGQAFYEQQDELMRQIHEQAKQYRLARGLPPGPE